VTTDADAERNRLFDTIERDLAGVSRAMERLDGGTYFDCESCGAPVAEDLLSESPTTSRCPNCPAA
jgi:RNA polymerase-binding transcription factor DksA